MWRNGCVLILPDQAEPDPIQHQNPPYDFQNDDIVAEFLGKIQ
ncbi:MAG: hypothetical protein K0R14_1578 [Burkholderiales bacterium]|jgi:hypothetical protein|nr:hypothetical protein [Burkholderiales bacterium]